MTNSVPLGSSEKNTIQGLENELNQYLKEGKDDFSKLAHIRDELKALLKNKNIPENVKHCLKEAIQDLHPMPGETVGTFNIQDAKSKLDDALSA